MLFAEDNIYTLFFDRIVQYFWQIYVFPESRFFFSPLLYTQGFDASPGEECDFAKLASPYTKVQYIQGNRLGESKNIPAPRHKACIDFVR